MGLLFPKHRERWVYPVKEERLGKIVFLGFRNLTEIFSLKTQWNIYICMAGLLIVALDYMLSTYSVASLRE